MAEFTLPATRRSGAARAGRHAGGARSVKEFKVYRWNPDDDANPRIDTYEVDIDDCGPMVLDALIKIKNEIDPTLTFRRSCREGICGSCAMNIDGTNTLACTKAIEDIDGDESGLSAAAHAGGQGPGAGPDAVLRAVRLIKPWLQDRARRRRTASACSRRRTAPSSTACTNASCAPAARPPARATGGTATRYLGPAVLLQAYRWIVDSRDEDTGARLDDLEDPFKLYRCHTIMNCTKTCPKGLNPAKAIAEIKQPTVGENGSDRP